LHARNETKRTPGTDAEGILEELSTRQHLTPHRQLGEAVAEIVEHVGACPEAASRAMAWLELDASQSIGRLRRSELIQLARAMYRHWSQAVAAAAPPAGHSSDTASQPA
jgi:hypothetical protein